MSAGHSLSQLGPLIAEKRGTVGLRATAREIGVSPATLSRVENGKMPDVENFRRICRWLEVDPALMLGFEPENFGRPVATVHYRSSAALSPETGRALGELIVKAHRTFVAGTERESED